MKVNWSSRYAVINTHPLEHCLLFKAQSKPMFVLSEKKNLQITSAQTVRLFHDLLLFLCPSLHCISRKKATQFPFLYETDAYNLRPSQPCCIWLLTKPNEVQIPFPEDSLSFPEFIFPTLLTLIRFTIWGFICCSTLPLSDWITAVLSTLSTTPQLFFWFGLQCNKVHFCISAFWRILIVISDISNIQLS